MPPRLKAVFAKKGRGKAAALPAQKGEVHLLQVRPDEPGRGERVEHGGQGRDTVMKLPDRRGVEAQAVVRHQQRSRGQQFQPRTNLLRAKRKDFPGEKVLGAYAVNGGEVVQQAVSFNVEEQGRGFEGGKAQRRSLGLLHLIRRLKKGTDAFIDCQSQRGQGFMSGRGLLFRLVRQEEIYF